MSVFSVPGVDLATAIKAVVPHVPRDKDDELSSCVHFHLTSEAELLVSGHGGGTAGVAVVPVFAEGWDGELVDFALHRDDAAQLPGVLAPTDAMVLEVTVTHQVTRLPGEFHPKTGAPLPTREARATEVEFVEADRLFGGRRVRMAGLDARDYSPHRVWSKLRASATATSVPVELSTDPELLGRFRTATKLYKEDAHFRTVSGEELIVQIGDHFMGRCTGWSTAPPADWSSRLDAALGSAPGGHGIDQAVREFAGTVRDLAVQGVTVEVQTGLQLVPDDKGGA